MMKTITEYQPLIFSRILRAARGRTVDRRAAWWNVAVVSAYCAAGFWFVVDTGFAPWNWQFWIVFTPFFIAAELLVGEISAIVEAWRTDVPLDEEIESESGPTALLHMSLGATPQIAAAPGCRAESPIHFAMNCADDPD